MDKVEYLLTCLGEECNEVAQRASKALRFGLREVQPGQTLTNAQRIVVEVNDLLAILEMLHEAGAVLVKADPGAIAAKKEKVRKFMAYSAGLGTLTGDVNV